MIINEGISFSLWQGVPVWVIFIAWILLLVVCYLEQKKIARIGLVIMILGGGVNIGQRLLYGGVVDNMWVFGVLYNNLADYLIVVGLLVYGYSSFVRR